MVAESLAEDRVATLNPDLLSLALTIGRVRDQVDFAAPSRGTKKTIHLLSRPGAVR